ncbi:MAG: sigma-70 family RNA polymerase sigma factor [Planctomycetota bacterium]|nr:sigma-70 family RNA polymerase sigma factor [Planctomycetota bacterium]
MGKKEASGRPAAVEQSCNPRGALRLLSAEELALRSQQGCQESFTELVGRYEVRLYQFLHNKTDNIQDAEDLVQDTFVKAYWNIHRYQTSWKFSTWLFTIAARLASSHNRSLYHQQTVADVESGPANTSRRVGPVDATIQQEMQEGLWTVARSLSRNQYEALWLRYAEDMSIKEIAKVMRKTQVSVKVLLYRARMNLAERLRNMAAEDEKADRALRNEKLPIMKMEGA